jgi:serine/threonine protein kinase
MVELEPPFMEFPPLAALYKTLTETPPISNPAHYSDDLIRFLQRCLEKDFRLRVSHKQALQSLPLENRAKNVLSSLLKAQLKQKQPFFY